MNEEILTYTTPNSEKLLRQIHQYEFARMWKKNLNKNNKNLIWGIIFILLAVGMLFYRQYLGLLFLGFGLFYVFSYINYISVYQKHKKTFNESLNKEVEKLHINTKDVIWEFTPEYFKFKDYKSELTFPWNTITYSILDNRYVYITAMPSFHIILDKINIDDSTYNKTVTYLNTRSRVQEL
ncbi:hypothetical protein [Chryseobacterium pennipullorum]|uniref:YcxB family protein n=1 Tax=Chryseobacterium pennipullorum TaxID=2258963 RepID=A0A3D9B0I7_9FLAO|nr:hypothetical protein [Chryseobacterium pennipullorum]REC47019.1 hypothetical protein DRF67_12425 [Chryseobacterium pennipullorum]